MRKLRFAALAVALMAVAGTGVGQDTKKEDPKKDSPKEKAKGFLPPFWKDIVSEDQKTKVYEIQGKYKKEIDDLKAKVKEVETKRDKEMLAVLSPDQKKSLEEKIKAKAGIGKEK